MMVMLSKTEGHCKARGKYREVRAPSEGLSRFESNDSVMFAAAARNGHTVGETRHYDRLIPLCQITVPQLSFLRPSTRSHAVRLRGVGPEAAFIARTNTNWTLALVQ